MIQTDLEESTCPGCGCRVVVAKTSEGKRVLLNQLPSRDGYFYFNGRGEIVGIEAGKRAPEGLPLFVDHKRTCAQREMF